MPRVASLAIIAAHYGNDMRGAPRAVMCMYTICFASVVKIGDTFHCGKCLIASSGLEILGRTSAGASRI
jgi:hypothetical protein